MLLVRGRSVVVPTLLLGFLLCGLVTGGPPENTLIWDAVFDVGHAVLFIFVTWLTLGIAQAGFHGISGRQSVAGALIVTLGIAAVSELVQFFDPARHPSVDDFLRDAGGACIFLLMRFSTVRHGVRAALSRTMRSLALLVAIGIATPLLLVGGMYTERDRAFPTLLAFDGSRRERQFLSVGNATLTPTSTHSPRAADMALLCLRPGTYSGFVLDEPYPDWRGYERLAFTLVLDQDSPMELTLRIHDRWHDGKFEDRFNRKLWINRGAQQVVIRIDDIRTAPASRALDLSRIRGVAVYAYRLERPACIRLGSFRLE